MDILYDNFICTITKKLSLIISLTFNMNKCVNTTIQYLLINVQKQKTFTREMLSKRRFHKFILMFIHSLICHNILCAFSVLTVTVINYYIAQLLRIASYAKQFIVVVNIMKLSGLLMDFQNFKYYFEY